MSRRDFLEDVALMAGCGETAAAVAVRLGTTEANLERRLRRDPAGMGLWRRLVANASGGHVHHGSIRRWAS